MMRRSLDKIRRRIGRSVRRIRNGPPNECVFVGESTLLARTRFGSVIYLEAKDVSLTPQIALTGEWEPWIEDLFRRAISTGDVVVDIGANCGYYALAASQCVGSTGRVVAIEPNPRLVDLMRRSVAANDLRNTVEIFQGAVLDREIEIELGFPADYLGSTSIFISQEGWTEPVTTIRTGARPLQKYLRTGEKVDVLKIDTEGAEPLIWQGAENVLQANRDITVFMEFAPSMIQATLPPADFLAQIRSLDFNVFEASQREGLVARSDAQLLAAPWSELVLSRRAHPIRK